MKKLILSLSALIISLGAIAQTDSLNRKMNPTDTRKHESTEMNKSHNSGEQKSQNANPTSKTKTTPPDGYMMDSGRMIYYKGGKATVMESTETLSNGTKIMSDGTYTTTDGRKMTLHNGEQLGMDGKMMPMAPKSGENTRTKTDLQRDKGTMPDSTGRKPNSPHK